MEQEKGLLKKPGISLSFRFGRISIYRSTLEILGYPEFYRFLYNPDRKEFAIEACGMDAEGAHKLPEIKDGEVCAVKSMDMVELLYSEGGWRCRRTYRMRGMAYKEQRIVSFRLDEAEEILHESGDDDEAW